MEHKILEIIGLALVLSCILSPILLIFREREEDICKPFTPIIYNKLNFLGRLIVIPFVLIFDAIGLLIISIIGICIFIFNKIFFRKEKDLITN